MELKIVWKLRDLVEGNFALLKQERLEQWGEVTHGHSPVDIFRTTNCYPVSIYFVGYVINIWSTVSLQNPTWIIQIFDYPNSLL